MAAIIVIGHRGNGLLLNIGQFTLPSSSFMGVLTAVISLLCVIMLVTDYSRGSTIAIILLILQCITGLRPLILRRSLESLPGLIYSIIIIMIIVILRHHISQREKDSVTDQLTGLYNRRGLGKMLAEYDDDDSYYYIYIDIDDFKLINDNLGHRYGDVLLKIISCRIKEISGSKSIASRIGGDEYVIIVTKKDAPDVIGFTRKLIDSIGEKIEMVTENSTVDCFVTASVGISCFPDDSEDPETLMKYSDIAMYEAKKSGKNSFCVFDSSLEAALKRQAELENLIKEGLANNYFYLVYQPQYLTADKKLRGFESLLRLSTPDGKRVSPGEFIPAAEKTDLILQIDEYVIKKAMQDFSKAVRSSGNSITISVNVSAKNICRIGFADMVRRAAEETGFPCKCFEVEITEYCLANSLDIATLNIKKLKAMGIRVALDDFGTGYASLSYLSKLSIDLLKIDKSFIDDIDKDKKSNDFISAVISIGHIHDCKVISEGVEHENQLELLRDRGCDYIQGFIWGKPLAHNDAITLTKKEASL